MNNKKPVERQPKPYIERRFLVSQFDGAWNCPLSDESQWITKEYNERQLKSLAEYYYHNSEVMDKIDFRNIDNCIAFVERVDVVKEIK